MMKDWFDKNYKSLMLSFMIVELAALLWIALVDTYVAFFK